MTSAPRPPWSGRRVVLGVCGGIAAYKVAQVARDLTRLGATVDVVLTESGRRFVGESTFEGLTGRSPETGMFATGEGIRHIRLAREADLVCVAPATADFLARAAHGRANCLLTAILLATDAPVLLCPAMNDGMWAHPQTERNISHLRDSLGYRILGPATGPLAQGEGEGPGRLVEPHEIVEHIGRALSGSSVWRGRRVVVAAGPTREPVDAVRFLSNRSSGRMGYALAAAAWHRGAEVVLVSGPSLLEPPVGPGLRRVETAADMEDAVREEIASAEVLIMAAAVADFRPEAAASGKIRKGDAPVSIPVEPAPDVLNSTREARPPGMVVLGFALEVGDGHASAREKLREKGLDMVVLNRADEPDAGFETLTNRVVLLDREGGEEELPLLPKEIVAEEILDRFSKYLPSSI